MGQRRCYQKKPDAPVVAVQLDLDTDGFTYQKWGGTQRCKRGDWVVLNRGDTYTVDEEVFARTYREVAPGQFVKTAKVWAERAERDGAIPTKEGVTHYVVGDFLVFNDEQGIDGYAVSAAKFEAMYEPID